MSAVTSPLPPCVIHEDEHLLVVNKPPGWNTHSPSPYAGEGIYEWLKHREPRWASLAIIHRLDKETSGVMVFGKTPLANKSLTEQFAGRKVAKSYVLITDKEPPKKELRVRSLIERSGDRYVSTRGDDSETVFLAGKRLSPHLDLYEIVAHPQTGRTHQIRVHASASGFPILGDTLYGGRQWFRVCLHALSLQFVHPLSSEEVCYQTNLDFEVFCISSVALRNAIINREDTDAYRESHGASDGCTGWYSDRLGDRELWQTEHHWPLPPVELPPAVEISSKPQGAVLNAPCRIPNREISKYRKLLNRDVRKAVSNANSPELAEGPPLPSRFIVWENGVKFELRFDEGYSVGLFLDQRDNRRRLLVNHVGAGFGPVFPVERAFSPSHSSLDLNGAKDAPDSQRDGQDARPTVLNAFAYTCAFSVCAAKAGAITTSLDLSKKYLDWGRRNFGHNGLDPSQHDFIYGDCFDWLKRLAKKGRVFDQVLLDPPTFSQSKQSGVWRADKDYGKLTSLALPLVKPGGVLFASCNAATLKPEKFLEMIEVAVRQAGRKILQQHYVPQPPDFPVSREESAYLKTVWLRVG